LKGRVDKIDEMLEVASSFYQEFYQEKSIYVLSWTLLFEDLPKLSDEDRTLLDRDINVKECFDALRTMPDGKTPGDDGISAEVWWIIFRLIGKHYVRIINVAKEKGRFQPEFLRALLPFLKKKDTCDSLMKNFRALSLMNIDYKTLPKFLSARLPKFLGNIIHGDQTCF